MKLYSILLSVTLVACGGGGETVAVSNKTSLPNVTLMSTVERLPIVKNNSVHNEYTEVHYTLTSNGYFKENPTGHAAIVLRGNIETSPYRVRGVGMVIGNVSEASNPMPDNPATEPNQIEPSVQIETWFNGIDSGDFLLASKSTPPELKDNVNYDVVLQSRVSLDKSIQTIRMTVSNNGTLLYDTGTIVDPNKYIDTSFNDVYAGHVFQSPNANRWELHFTNIFICHSFNC